ncbi:glycosyl hydrolases family 31-domain-containing protein [Aspergillus novoparasiticus]|uniref:alpha-glucosidase n=1 Tax=Aspergillus novoparasiticus TaxID=986946 RepID=A0A5N6FB62_9EURO|nr:glycosyl hydrolases family 31-domain-containing protein [Aspergillus novoparasiticus]
MPQKEFCPKSYQETPAGAQSSGAVHLRSGSDKRQFDFSFEPIRKNLFRVTFSSEDHPLPPFPSVTKPVTSLEDIHVSTEHGFQQKTIEVGDVVASVEWANTPVVSLSWKGTDKPLYRDLSLRSYVADASGIAHYTEHDRNDLHVGLGEKRAPMDLSGRHFQLSATDSFGYDVYNTDPLYKHIPLLIKASPAGCVAIFSTTHGRGTWSVGSEIDGLWGHFKVYRQDYGGLEQYLIVGKTLKDVVRSYAELVGHPILVPRWAYGYISGGYKYTMMDEPPAHQALMEFADKLKEHEIPCSGHQMSSGYSIAEVEPKVRNVFTWNKYRFPNPEEWIAKYHSRGIRLITNIKPFLLGSHPDFQKLIDGNGFFKNPETNEPGHLTASPPQRWVGWGYETDPEVWTKTLKSGEEQFWFGDTIMVGGVYEPGVNFAKIYLPRKANDQFDFGYVNMNEPYTYFASGQWVEVPSEWKKSIPLLARIGGAIPVGKSVHTRVPGDETPASVAVEELDDYRGVEIFPPRGSSHGQAFSTTWFEDDGISLKPSISQYTVTYSSTDEKVTIGFTRDQKSGFVPAWKELDIILHNGDERRVVSDIGKPVELDMSLRNFRFWNCCVLGCPAAAAIDLGLCDRCRQHFCALHASSPSHHCPWLENVDVPSPKLHDYGLRNDPHNDVGVAYMLIDELPGIPLLHKQPSVEELRRVYDDPVYVGRAVHDAESFCALNTNQDCTTILSDDGWEKSIKNEIAELLSQTNTTELVRIGTGLNNGVKCTFIPGKHIESDAIMGCAKYQAWLSFDNGEKWLVQIPHTGNRDVPSELVEYLVASEYATLRFLEPTKIPAPRAFTYRLASDPSNRVGVSYIIMEALPGRPFDANEASPSQKAQVLEQVAEIMLEIHKNPVPFAGSPVVDKGQIQISTLAKDPFVGLSTSGPFTTSLGYILTITGQYMDLIADGQLHHEHPLEAFLFYHYLHHNGAAIVAADMQGSFFLKHVDDKGNHLLVDEEFNVVGIVSWQFARTVPASEAFGPSYLTADLASMYSCNGSITDDDRLLANALRERGAFDLASYAERNDIMRRLHHGLGCGSTTSEVRCLLKGMVEAVSGEQIDDLDLWMESQWERCRRDSRWKAIHELCVEQHENRVALGNSGDLRAYD